MTLIVLLVSLATYSTVIQGKLFVLNDPETGKPCILVDVDFTLDLAAVRSEKVISMAQISSEDDGIQIDGSCGNHSAVLNFFFPQKVNWALKFKQDKNEAFLNRLVQFVPKSVFGEKVPISDYQLMDDPGVKELGNASYSYECPVAEIVEYEVVTVTTKTTNFTVTANVSYIHAQAFNIKKGNFSPSFICKGALTTPGPTSSKTSASVNQTTLTVQITTVTQKASTSSNHSSKSPTPTTQTSPSAPSKEPSPPPTSSPKPPLKLYTVKDGNITCIALQAALALDINYPVEGKGTTKTAQIFVPQDAKSSGNCKLSSTSQDLTISFFKDWELTFVFSTTKKNSLESLISSPNEDQPKHPEYKISQIELAGSSDKDKFPGTTWPAGQKFNFKTEKPNYPDVNSNKDYYKCDSTLKTELTPDATVESQKFEVKAFNRDNKVDFSGSAAVCAADSGSSKKKTYIIVGCVLAAIVLIAFIAFVVMRVIKKRRENYGPLN